MSDDLINKRVEELLQASAEEVKGILPPTIDKIYEYGIEKILAEVPDLLRKIMGKLVAIDAAKFFSEVPEVSDKFMDFLLEGIGVMAAKSEEFRSVLERTRELNVNFEASDSPFTGHFKISQGKLSGGSGLLHFKDQDYRYLGATAVLMGLLAGERVWGLGKPMLLTEGHPGFQRLLVPVMRGISKLIKGNQQRR